MADDTSSSTKNEPTGVEVAQADAQKIYDQGFAGEKVDPNPNEIYTVAGVTGQYKPPAKKS